MNQARKDVNLYQSYPDRSIAERVAILEESKDNQRYVNYHVDAGIKELDMFSTDIKAMNATLVQLLKQITNDVREINAKFDKIDARFDKMDAKFEAKFDQMDAKIDSRTGWIITLVIVGILTRRFTNEVQRF